MAFNPSEEQLKAINENKANLVVSASAGSGKTSTMINRIIRLIEKENVSLKEILVLTFTNNASNDMKQKLYAELSIKAKTNKKCFESLFEVGLADIGTIDSFCQKLVRKYFYIAEIDPAFKVIDEMSSILLKQKAMEKTFEHFFVKNDKNFTEFIKGHFEKRNLKSVENIVNKIYNFFQISENKSDLDFLTKTTHTEKFENNKSVKIVCEFLREEISEIVADFLSLKNGYTSNAVIKFLESHIEDFNKILKAQSARDFFEKMMLINIESINKIKIEKGSIDEEEKNNLKNILSKTRPYVTDLKSWFSAESELEIQNSLKKALKNADFALILTNYFLETYEKIKKEKNYIDFSTLEQLAFLVLNQENVKDDLFKTYRYVFIDEFQDVNTIQNAIFKNLTDKKMAFSVGDAKQSIYGFRLTDPQILIDKINKIKNENLVTEKTIFLNKNYRSTKEILEFCNYVFSKIMTVKSCGIDFADGGAFDTSNLLLSKEKCEVILVKKREEVSKELPKIYSLLDDKINEENETIKSEALAIANIIIEAKKKGFKNGDIAILSRKKGAALKAIVAELKKMGFSISDQFTSNLLNAKETCFLHSLLRLVYNFKNDIDLVSVMLSPLFNFSADELVEIRNENPDAQFFHESFLLYNKEGFLKEKLKKFHNDILKLNKISENLSVFELVLEIVNMFEVVKVVSMLKDGDESVLNSFIEAIKKLELRHVLDYIELTKNGELILKSEQIVDENKIQVSTIHSSKGLEYKVVILVLLESAFNATDLTSPIFVSKQLGVCGNTIDLDEEEKLTNIAKNASKILKQKEILAEEIRIFYVALTRAKEKLFLVGASNEKTLLKHSKKPKSFLDLLKSALTENELSTLASTGVLNIDGFLNINYLEFSDELINSPVQNIVSFKPNPELVKEFKEKLNKTLIFEPVLAKNTVTRILNDENKGLKLESFKFSDVDNENKILEGNAYHKFFEKFNFNVKSFEIETKNVLNKIGSEFANKIDLSVVEKFLKSNLLELVKNRLVLKEQKFIYKLENGTLVQGIVDLVAFSKDDFILVDYKTTRLNSEAVVNKYKPQLMLYKKAIEHILGLKANKVLIFSIFDAKLIEIFE